MFIPIASCNFKLDKELVGPVRVTVRDCMCFGKALKSLEICTPVPGAAIFVVNALLIT